MPIPQALLHALIPQKGEGRLIEGDQFKLSAGTADEPDNPAGDGVVDAGQELGLFPDAL